jgi:hypothetical protein
VLGAAFRAVGALCESHAVNKISLGRAGLCPLVASGMQSFPKDAGLQAAAAGALAALASEDDDNLKQVRLRARGRGARCMSGRRSAGCLIPRQLMRDEGRGRGRKRLC